MNSEVLQLYLTAQNQLFIKGAILYQLVLVTVGFFCLLLLFSTIYYVHTDPRRHTQMQIFSLKSFMAIISFHSSCDCISYSKKRKKNQGSEFRTALCLIGKQQNRPLKTPNIKWK